MMQRILHQLLAVTFTTGLAASLALPAAEAPARTAAKAPASTSKFPRLKNGKPNLNGIWQVMNTAN